MAPLIPYIEAPELPLSFLTHIPLLNQLFNPAHPPSIKPFGTLVALGVYIGSAVAMRHARERKLDEKKMSDFIFWVVGIGFIGAHMLDAVFYHPARLAKDPLYLFALWEGLSSYGGFIGAIVGALAWRARRRQPIFGYIEAVNSAFPLAWVFGRAGCASVHDHPGQLSDAWFAVRWPAGIGGGHVVGRLDLGLIEMALTIPLALAFAILWHRKPQRPLGFYTGIMCVAYAPVRFVLDFLREEERDLLGGDPRYGSLTPAQWACFGLLGLGVYFLWKCTQGGAALPGDAALVADGAAAEGATTGAGGASADDDGDDGDDAPVAAAVAASNADASPAVARKARRKARERSTADDLNRRPSRRS